MADLDHRYVFAVGQKSFELDGNAFSTLVPIATIDGEVIEGNKRHAEFPNRGRVWWMVRGDSRVTEAPPGTLLVAFIEPAVRPAGADPTKDDYQVKQPTVPTVQQIVEIVTPSDPPNTADGLLDGFTMVLDHEPTGFVLVRMVGCLVGPLRAVRTGPAGQRDRRPEIAFEKSPSAKIYMFPEASLNRKGHFSTRCKVWPSDQMLNADEGVEVVIEAITGSLLDALGAEHEPISLFSTKEIIGVLVKELPGRRERKEFRDRLDDLIENANLLDGMQARVREVVERLDRVAEGADELFEAVVTDPDFEPQIEGAIETRVARAVEDRTAEINAQARQRVEELNGRLAVLKNEIEARSTELRRIEADHTQRLVEERTRHQVEIDAKASELAEMEVTIGSDLAEVVARLEGGRRELMRDYLALRPLLEEGRTAAPREGAEGDRPAARSYRIEPPKRPEPERDISEREFVDRFRGHVEDSGFSYTEDVLLSFHLAAKQDAFVLLAGPAGTGKSSLPRLYAEALVGEAGDASYLPVDVAPTWMGPEDLFGYVDVAERRFIPSPSGAFDFLARAALEHRASGQASGMHVLCLDEINLAQPEHYLSNVLQAVSRPVGERMVALFDASFGAGSDLDGVGSDDPMRDFARLPLGPNLILCGTMNRDETVTNLSNRFLDRANLIEIPAAGSLSVLSADVASGRKTGGPTVRRSDLRRWSRPEGTMAPDAVRVLADIQDHLVRIGAPLTSRRHRGIDRFVAGAGDLCDPLAALDMQVRQRIVPQLDRLFMPDVLEEVERLAQALRRRLPMARSADALSALVDRERAMTSNPMSLDDR